MKIFNKFIRNRAIKTYIKKLPKLLAKDYTKSKNYTPMQVRKTIERSGLNLTYACYGIAIFSSRKSFDQYHKTIGESCSYDVMRTDIADKHFYGNCDFTASDVTSVSSDYGAGFDCGDGGYDSGGDCGGGD